jgi:threonine dehydrogenase-like Zn-dependent dehydrogenase
VSRTGKQVPVDDAAIRDHVALGLECAGHEQATLDLLRVVRKRGEVVLVGVPWVERAHVSAHQVFHEIFHRYVVVRSGWEWELPRHDTEYRTGSIFGNLRTALRWLAEGRVDTRGIAVTFNPQDCADAYALVDGGAADALSVVFDWHPGS